MHFFANIVLVLQGKAYILCTFQAVSNASRNASFCNTHKKNHPFRCYDENEDDTTTTLAFIIYQPLCNRHRRTHRRINAHHYHRNMTSIYTEMNTTRALSARLCMQHIYMCAHSAEESIISVHTRWRAVPFPVHTKRARAHAHSHAHSIHTQHTRTHTAVHVHNQPLCDGGGDVDDEGHLVGWLLSFGIISFCAFDVCISPLASHRLVNSCSIQINANFVRHRKAYRSFTSNSSNSVSAEKLRTSTRNLQIRHQTTPNFGIMVYFVRTFAWSFNGFFAGKYALIHTHRITPKCSRV